jgi:hypothetical protein
MLSGAQRLARTENPRVGGSIPPLGTTLFKGLGLSGGVFSCREIMARKYPTVPNGTDVGTAVGEPKAAAIQQANARTQVISARPTIAAASSNAARAPRSSGG